MFVGCNVKQGHGVPQVLNLETGAITGQYHVVIDDWFTTVHSEHGTKIDFDSDDWYKTFGLTEWQYVPDDEEAPPQVETPTSASEGADRRETVRRVRDDIIDLTGTQKKKNFTPIPAAREYPRQAKSQQRTQPKPPLQDPKQSQKKTPSYFDIPMAYERESQSMYFDPPTKTQVHKNPPTHPS